MEEGRYLYVAPSALEKEQAEYALNKIVILQCPPCNLQHGINDAALQNMQ